MCFSVMTHRSTATRGLTNALTATTEEYKGDLTESRRQDAGRALGVHASHMSSGATDRLP